MADVVLECVLVLTSRKKLLVELFRRPDIALDMPRKDILLDKVG